MKQQNSKRSVFHFMITVTRVDLSGWLGFRNEAGRQVSPYRSESSMATVTISNNGRIPVSASRGKYYWQCEHPGSI